MNKKARGLQECPQDRLDFFGSFFSQVKNEQKQKEIYRIFIGKLYNSKSLQYGVFSLFLI